MLCELAVDNIGTYVDVITQIDAEQQYRMRDVSLMSRLQLRVICLMLRVPAFWTSSLAAW